MNRADAAAALEQFVLVTGVSTSCAEYIKPQAEVQHWLDHGLIVKSADHRCEGWIYFLPNLDGRFPTPDRTI